MNPIEQNTKETDRMNGAFNTSSEAEAAYEVTQWIGAIIFYFLLLGKTPFKDLWTKKYALRNTLVGYLLNLSLAGLIFYILYQTR